jgi:hypothetical protein
MIPTDWLELEGSHIRKVKFVPNTKDNRGDVLVEFGTGKTYRFKDVPAIRVEHMVHSSSPGEYFRGYIRGEYDSEPI